jgi:hypothetical protein
LGVRSSGSTTISADASWMRRDRRPLPNDNHRSIDIP